jgi:hypothetical protein
MAAEFQGNFFFALRLHVVLLVVAAIISAIGSPYSGSAIFQALVLLGALGCAIYLYASKPDRHWYAGRALAESVKTSTWRFIIRAEPFNVSDEQDRHNFLLRLKQVVEQNKDLAGRLSTHLGSDQISEEMERVRKLSTESRQAYYRENRIVDQLVWYANKSAFNKRRARGFYFALFATISVAIVFALCKIQFPTASFWPTDALVTLAASFLSWIQAKRYQELAASYALTAHEIGFIRAQASRAMTDDELSAFVGDAENAFSREHTQWVARRDA